MIKILKLISIFLSILFLLNACSSVNQKDFIDEPEYQNISGILKTKVDETLLGTHILLTEDKEKIPLRSLTYNLSKKMYLNNEVELEGFYNPDDEVFHVTDIKLLNVSDEQEDIDGNFESYTNTELGFGLSYPSDWEISEINSEVVFSNADNKVVLYQEPFHFKSDGDESTTNAALKKYIEDVRNYNFSEKMVRVIGKDSLNALYIEHDNEYLFYRSGLIYGLIGKSSADGNFIEFQDMVNSFRFLPFSDDINIDLDTAETPDIDLESYTSFESLPYSFTAVYPDQWYYSGSAKKSNGVLHHYGFSNEPIEDGNELISMDILSSIIPNGEASNVNGSKLTKVLKGNLVEYYTEENGFTFKVAGSMEYEDIILVMVGSISPLKNGGDE